MASWLRAGACILAVLGAIACGGESHDASKSDSDGSSGGNGNDNGNTGGTSGDGNGTGAGAGGTTETSTGDPNAVSAGSGAPAAAGTAAFAPATCDANIVDTPLCGLNVCPGVSVFTPCVIRCCLPNNVCGYRDSTVGATTDCVAAPSADPDCPDVNLFGTAYPGCCMDDGQTCGYIAAGATACMMPFGGGSTANCDGTSDEDAGVP